ncbi:MAG: ATP synthase F1 subunit epsilon [Spirochaetia bacterium]|nr:ATP synthase F1 subunit epsilon [Spirochaetia bacterium]
MEKTMNLDIVTPESKVFSGRIRSLTAPGINGEFGILPEHAAFATVLEPGVVTLVDEKGKEDLLAVSGGYIEVDREKVILLVETAEREDEIDIDTLKRRKDEKEKILKSKSAADVDYDMIKANLMREMSHLRAVEMLKKRTTKR